MSWCLSYFLPRRDSKAKAAAWHSDCWAVKVWPGVTARPPELQWRCSEVPVSCTKYAVPLLIGKSNISVYVLHIPRTFRTFHFIFIFNIIFILFSYYIYDIISNHPRRVFSGFMGIIFETKTIVALAKWDWQFQLRNSFKYNLICIVVTDIWCLNENLLLLDSISVKTTDDWEHSIFVEYRRKSRAFRLEHEFSLHLKASRVNALFSRVIGSHGYQIYRKNHKHAPPSNEEHELYIVEHACVCPSGRQNF